MTGRGVAADAAGAGVPPTPAATDFFFGAAAVVDAATFALGGRPRPRFSCAPSAAADACAVKGPASAMPASSSASGSDVTALAAAARAEARRGSRDEVRRPDASLRAQGEKKRAHGSKARHRAGGARACGVRARARWNERVCAVAA